MVRSTRFAFLAFLCLILPLALLDGARAMPQFAREYGLPCSTCHAHIPKLNALGEQFAANGYRFPDQSKKRTLPFTIWVSEIGQLRGAAPRNAKAVLNRFRIVSAGPIGNSGGYMFEWNPVFRDFLADGSTRESNGRFEDLFAFTGIGKSTSIWIGQFRAMSQIDESGKVFLTDPLVFSRAVPGEDALSGFAPSGRSPAIRLMKEWSDEPGSYEGMYATTALVFPGDLVVPADASAESGSFKLGGKPKGVFLEAYRKKGMESIGGHVFFGDNERRLFGLLGQKNDGAYHWEAGISRAEWGQGKEWRSSISLAWIPSVSFASAIRMDNVHTPGQRPIFAPLLSYVTPLGPTTGRFILEGKLQEHQAPIWLLEFRVLY